MNASLIEKAVRERCELAAVDFKASFDTASKGEWVEIIKDLVAMANSGGGTVLIGVTDDGAPSRADLSNLNGLDPATVGDKLRTYTETHFTDVTVGHVIVDSLTAFAISIGSSDVPAVFVKPGTYPIDKVQQKTAFGVGTVYFRHGAKSEPADSHDLRDSFERYLKQTRSGWLENIRKVVEAPPGARVSVLDLGATSTVRLTHDPAAPSLGVPTVDDTHPFRQKELVRVINERLAGRRTVTTHDILCIRRAHDVHKNFTYCYNLNYTSPQYSHAFVDWIVQQYESDPEFFELAHRKHTELKEASKRE